jgi:hypothetical protein
VKKKKSRLRTQIKKKEELRRSSAPPPPVAENAQLSDGGEDDPFEGDASSESDAPSASSASPSASSAAPKKTESSAPSARAGSAAPGKRESAAPSSRKSTPPDPDHEDSGLHHDFFAAPPPPRMPQGMGFDDDHDHELDAPKLRVYSEQAQERRKKFVRHVTWVVAGCVVLVAIAGVRHAFRTEEPPPAPSAITITTSPEPTGSTVVLAATSGGSASPAQSAATSTEGDAAALAQSQSDAGPDAAVLTADTAADAAVAAAAPSADASAAPAVVASPGDMEEAAKQRNASKNALESGRLKDAIASGERAVSLDPTDSDAWLYLGAAYQETGDQGNANRCYRACLSQGTHGNKSECGAMLR